MKSHAGAENIGVAGSHPARGAWIEIATRAPRPAKARVAPLAGAWIEILLMFLVFILVYVAPLAGAWIEMR